MAGHRSSGRLAAAARCGTEPILTSPAVRPAASARARRGGAAWCRGMRAEDAACAALVRDGWTILLRRARTPAGEIDLVVERREPAGSSLLVFVEVKTRPLLSDAAASLSRRQQTRLLAAAGILLGQHPEWDQDSIRFDLLLMDAAGSIRRIADAFRIEQPD